MKSAAAPAGSQHLTAFAPARAVELFERFDKEVERSRTTGDPDAIHDLRVSVRRLSQCLDVFSKLFPGKSALRIRKRIRRIRRLAGDVRDRDIALELVEKHELPAPNGFTERIRQERADAYAKLVKKLGRLSKRAKVNTWRKELGLETQS